MVPLGRRGACKTNNTQISGVKLIGCSQRACVCVSVFRDCHHDATWALHAAIIQLAVMHHAQQRCFLCGRHEGSCCVALYGQQLLLLKPYIVLLPEQPAELLRLPWQQTILLLVLQIKR